MRCCVQQADDACSDHRMPPSDVPPGEPQDRVARHREPAIAIPVGLECPPGAMCRASVDLDDQAGLQPEEVDDVVEQRERSPPAGEGGDGDRGPGSAPRSSLRVAVDPTWSAGKRDRSGIRAQDVPNGDAAFPTRSSLQPPASIGSASSMRALERSCVDQAREVKDGSGGTGHAGSRQWRVEFVVGESPRTMDSDTASSPTDRHAFAVSRRSGRVLPEIGSTRAPRRNGD